MKTKGLKRVTMLKEIIKRRPKVLINRELLPSDEIMGKNGSDFLESKGIFSNKNGITKISLTPFYKAKDKEEFYKWASNWIEQGCCVKAHLDGRSTWLLEVCSTCDSAIQIILYYFLREKQKSKEYWDAFQDGQFEERKDELKEFQKMKRELIEELKEGPNDYTDCTLQYIIDLAKRRGFDLK